MRPIGRKIVAVVAMVAAGTMLYLERHTLTHINIESVFWVFVAALVFVLAICELLGVGARAATKPRDTGPDEK